MEETKKTTIKRPMSHKQLLIFPNESEYIMDTPREYLKDSQRKDKFTIKKLHEKWKRKINVNFKNIDKKFDIKKSQPIPRLKTEQDEIQDKQFFDLLHGIYYNKTSKEENNNIKSVKKIYDKYDDKYSYYLNTQNPWNNDSVFNLKDKKINEKNILKNIILAKKKNKFINNKNKNYKSLNERYIKDKILITEVKNKFIKDKKDELYKKIIYQNPELEKYPEKINAIIFKEMIKLFQEYAKFIEDKNNNSKLLSKHIFTDEEIFEKLQILLSYLKEHKQELDQKEFLEPLISDYNKILEKEEYLKKLDLKYNEYIEEKKRKTKYLLERRNNMLNIIENPIKNQMKEYKINYLQKSNIEESKGINNKKKEINYFLSAYKSIVDEKKEKGEINKKEEKKNKFVIIINEKSNNPHRNKIRSKENSETNLNNEIINKKIKRPKSSYGTKQINITYYHPGNYTLFKEGESEYNAWSCCLNEDKLSKGCCKKYEKVLNFLYKY